MANRRVAVATTADFIEAAEKLLHALRAKNRVDFIAKHVGVESYDFVNKYNLMVNSLWRDMRRAAHFKADRDFAIRFRIDLNESVERLNAAIRYRKGH